MTLNLLIDNVLLIIRNSNVGESEHLSRTLIEKWILSYRAKLIKQEIDKDKDISDKYITTIEPIHLDKVESVPGYYTYVGDKELPKLMDFNRRSAVVAVRDMFGNLIQVGNQTKFKLQKYRKATCKDYIAWVKDNKIYVQGDSNQLEYISVDVIADDPTESNACFDPDAEFPIPEYMIPTITDLIMSKELRYMVTMPSDETNDARDDNLNRYKA